MCTFLMLLKIPLRTLSFKYCLECILNPHTNLHNYQLYMFPKLAVICYSGCSVFYLNVFTNGDIPKCYTTRPTKLKYICIIKNDTHTQCMLWNKKFVTAHHQGKKAMCVCGRVVGCITSEPPVDLYIYKGKSFDLVVTLREQLY